MLPHAPKWHAVAVPLAANTLRIEALDVVDVVVSKLKRFHANDRSDISAMIPKGRRRARGGVMARVVDVRRAS